MSQGLSKKQLIDELASSAQLKKKDVANVLDQLAEITYREARNGFVIPNICKLKVTRKKGSKFRNPANGKLMWIGEHDVVNAVPLKKAKDRIAPRPENLAQELPEEESPKSTDSRETGSEQAATQETPSKESESQNIVFSCGSCGAIMEAPASEAGKKGECPYCGVTATIPSREQTQQEQSQEEKSGGEDQTGPETAGPPDDFFIFVCPFCKQEIEAPTSMIGQEANCPACESPIDIVRPSQVEKEDSDQTSETSETEESSEESQYTNTMRMDLSDLGL